MRLSLVVLCCSFWVAQPISVRHASALGRTSSSYTFKAFAQEHGKTYATAEERKYRESLFNARLVEIAAHNRDASQTYQKGYNQFMDVTLAEMKRDHMGYDVSAEGEVRASLLELNLEGSGKNKNTRTRKVKGTDDIPDEIDWRNKIDGWSTKFGNVKNQGNCGSCWAFAATAVFEAHVGMVTGEHYDLSEQELVNCVPNPRHCGGDGGCKGATSELALAYIAKRGHVKESTTEYVAQDKICGIPTEGDAKAKGAVATATGFHKLPSNELEPLMRAIATKGPIAVSVDASSWPLYHGGILDPGLKKGDKIDINHAVTLVGYGVENGTKYWTVRNSWGETWGERGHLRIKRNSEKQCWTDATPCHGIACEDECNTPVEVCGTCGMLYCSSYPEGVSLVKEGL